MVQIRQEKKLNISTDRFSSWIDGIGGALTIDTIKQRMPAEREGTIVKM
jgi:hypothetical protein